MADLWPAPELNQTESLSLHRTPAGFSDVIGAAAGLGVPLCCQDLSVLEDCPAPANLKLKSIQRILRRWELLVLIFSVSWYITHVDSFNTGKIYTDLTTPL